jgi:predicted nucleic acid-binding protein
MGYVRRIYWDTMLYVYWFEDNRKYADRVEAIYHAMQRRRDSLCCSSLVYAEVLAGPTITNDIEGKAAIDNFFMSPHPDIQIDVLPFSMNAAPIFAALRAEGLKAPDAMHLATAALAGVDLFLTNDRRLHKLSLPGMPFIATLDTDLF